MKKFTAVIILILVLPPILAFADSNGIFEIANNNIKIGNNVVEFKDLTYMKNDKIYVPLRNFCEQLGIPVAWNEGNGEIEIDIYNKNVPVSDKTTFKEDGVIPDEQTALAVGKIILEKYAGKSMEYETNEKVYYLTATFNQQYNGWDVIQMFKYKDKNKGWTAGDKVYVPEVRLSKQTGEVLYINTYSSFS